MVKDKVNRYDAVLGFTTPTGNVVNYSDYEGLECELLEVIKERDVWEGKCEELSTELQYLLEDITHKDKSIMSLEEALDELQGKFNDLEAEHEDTNNKLIHCERRL